MIQKSLKLILRV